MIVLAVVLVVLVAAYFLLPKVVKDEEEETESYVVTAMTGDTVTQISFTNEGTEYTFEKEDDIWYSTKDRTLSISQKTIDNLVDKAGNITSTTKIEGVTEFSQYGLDNPLHEIKLTANGTEHTIVMGDYNDITGEYYLYLKGESTVYTVASTVVTPFATTLEELVEEETAEEELASLDDLAADEKPAVQLVNQVITNAVKAGASDIHVDPLEKTLRVRYRIDGVLHEVLQQPIKLHPAVASRIKVIGGMDIAERRVPQDGRTTVKVDDRTFDIRIAVLPSVYGEKIVMRLLERGAKSVQLKDIKFSKAQADRFMKTIFMPKKHLFL